MVSIAETSIAEACVNFLKGLDWDVYQEVEASGGRVDIVARRKGTIWACEAKAAAGMPVIEQAYNWVPASNYSCIVVPSGIRRGSFAPKVCELLGVGIITVDRYALVHQHKPEVKVLLEPKLRRKRTNVIERHLREEQKDWAPAGNASGRYYTPWQGVAMALQAVVAQYGEQGVELKELLEKADKDFRYHYGKAPVKRNVVRWLDKGFIKGVRIVREGKIIRCFWVRDAK